MMMNHVGNRLLTVLGVAMLAACASAPGENAAPAPRAGASLSTTAMASRPLDPNQTFKRIVFASCAHQDEDQMIWAQIAKEGADLVLFMGDNVYGDVLSNDPALPELKNAYATLAASAPFASARAASPFLTVWDDHDYGMNDAGGEYPFKEQSEVLFHEVWAVPEEDPRRARPGLYGAWMLGAEDGRRLQVIILDTRYFRSTLRKTDEPGAKGKERYLPDGDPGKTMLGEAQWAWLAETLREPADLRLLVSPVQVIADGHGWEAWKMLPAERDRLYAAISEAGADNLIILSGDRHVAAFYERKEAASLPLFEATSSSLNLPSSGWRTESGETYIEPGPHRVSGIIYDANYGVLDIDWAMRSARVAIKNDEGDPVLRRDVAFSGAQR